MKKIFSSIIFMSLIVLFGCKEKNENIYVEISGDVDGEIAVDATSRTASFQISANTPWTIEVDQAWCKVSSKSGNKSEVITVTADETYDVDPRAAKVSVIVDGVSMKDIVITQNANVREATIAGDPTQQGSWHVCDNEVVSWEMDNKGVITSVIPTSAETVGNTKVGMELGVNMPATKGFSIETSVYIDDASSMEMTKRFMITLGNPANASEAYWDWKAIQFRSAPSTTWKKSFQLWDSCEERAGAWSNIIATGINTNGGKWHTLKIKWVSGEMQYFVDDVLIDTTVERDIYKSYGEPHDTGKGPMILKEVEQFKDVAKLKITTFYYYGVAHAEQYEMKWTLPVIKYIEE